MTTQKGIQHLVRKVAAPLLAVSLWAPPVTADTLSQGDYINLVEALTDRVVIPAYERFAIETSVLNETLRGFCGQPTIAGAKAVKQRFHDTMDAWAHARPILLGPVLNAPGPARFQFWPDKRGTGQRQLRLVFATKDTDVLTAQGLATKSVALGDLQALEYVLFNDPEASLQSDPFRCDYASAIADLQRGRAALLLQDWTKPGGFREQVIGAASGTEAFFDEREAASAYLNSVIGTFEIVRLQKLDRPMGLTLEGARSSRAESWRSERSFRNIALNLETVSAFFTVDSGINDLLAKLPNNDSAQVIGTLLADIAADLKGFDVPLSDSVEDPLTRPTLEGLLAKLRTLQSLVQEQVATDLALVPGFNATDGD